MILDNEQKQVIVEQDGEPSESLDMEIDSGSIGLLMNFLSKNIYSDGIGSTIREWVSNAWDANIEASTNNPIEVKLGINGSGRWEFTVEDKALGLDDEDVKNVISKYLKSTKRDKKNQLGAMGLGWKSGLAYQSSFSFICRKAGVERTYIMHEGEQGNQITLLGQVDTIEPNGVKMVIAVNNYDRGTFSQKIRQQLAYFSNTYITDEYSRFNNGYKIYENDLFKWSEISGDSKMHICLGEVYYPMDFSKLGIKDIHIPIAIKIGLEDKIQPTISRESLMLSPEAKAIILDKIKRVSEWFVGKYNEMVGEYKTYPETYEFIDPGYIEYEIEGKEFNISILEQYSDIKFEEPKIEGLKFRSAKYYKNKHYELVEDYLAIAEDGYNGAWKKKKIGDSLSRDLIGSPQSIVKINYTLAGNVKTFVRERYGNNITYIERSLRRSLIWYKQNIGLTKFPKEEWRDRIKEYLFIRDQLFGRCKEEYNTPDSKEFLDWLEEKKATRKANREKGITTGKYKGLNKQKGQVTLNIARKKAHGYDAVFGKRVEDISKLGQLGHLSVLVDKDMNREELYGWVKAFPKIKFLWIGEREVKHVLNNKHFISMEEFKESKPFARLATALFIESILELVPENEEVIYAAFPKYKDLKDTVEGYVSEHSISMDNDLRDIIIEGARDTGNWDMNIYTEALEFKKIMSKFGFLSFIDMDNYDEEKTRVAKNLVYIMLKWQKIEGKFVTDMELVDKVPIEVFDEQEAIIEVEEALESV